MPVHCFACATRDAERRAVSKAKSDDRLSDASFDGLYIAVNERGERG